MLPKQFELRRHFAKDTYSAKFSILDWETETPRKERTERVWHMCHAYLASMSFFCFLLSPGVQKMSFLLYHFQFGRPARLFVGL